MRVTPLAALLLAATAGGARAQMPAFVVLDDGGRPTDAASLVVAVDADDDDEDGHVDATQPGAAPEADLARVRLRTPVPAELTVEGPLRVLRDGRVATLPLRVTGEVVVSVQASRASARAGDAALVLSAGGSVQRLPVTAVGLTFLDAENRPLDAHRDAVGVSRRVTNDASLPRSGEASVTSADPANLRVELFDPAAPDTVLVDLEAVEPVTGRIRHRLRELPLTRTGAGQPHRSPFVRLVGDQMDLEAPGVGARVLRVALRDRVRVRYGASPAARQSLRVGRPGDEERPDAALRGSLRVRVLRSAPGARPTVGRTDADALRLGRAQVEIANEIWLQCHVGFGDPARADVEVVDPPPPTLLAIGDGDGLLARGGGEVRFLADGREVGPVRTVAGDRPVDTALRVADALRRAGFAPRVTQNARTETAAAGSADIVVRTTGGAFVTLSPSGELPLTTDARQGVAIGAVDLRDGVLEFGNMNASAGTLEERSLVKTLGDDDPSTVDLFIVNAFTSGTRQGEAFIEADAGAIINGLFLDRNGMRQQRAAWTQSHELGHILMDMPYHPDNLGPDRPWLLMDADTTLSLVTGPKRISDEECARMRATSASPAIPALLRPDDVRASPPTQVDPPYDRGYPRPD